MNSPLVSLIYCSCNIQAENAQRNYGLKPKSALEDPKSAHAPQKPQAVAPQRASSQDYADPLYDDMSYEMDTTDNFQPPASRQRRQDFGQKSRSLLPGQAQQRAGSSRGGSHQQQQQQQQPQFTPKRVPKMLQKQVRPDVYIPSVVSVGGLAQLLNVRLPRLQNKMRAVGMAEENSYDYVLTADYAILLAEEFGRNPVVDDEKAFDIYPS